MSMRGAERTNTLWLKIRQQMKDDCVLNMCTLIMILSGVHPSKGATSKTKLFLFHERLTYAEQ